MADFGGGLTDLVDRHMAAVGHPDAPTAVADQDEPTPEAEDTPPTPDDDGQPEEGAAADDADTDGDDAGDPDDDAPEQDEDEETDEDEPGQPEAGAEEPVLESVSAEELKRIQGDPALKAIHKSMQADYTRKTQAVAERERGIEDAETYLQTLHTEEGMAGYLADALTSHPTLIGRAFETVATGEAGEAFLVEVGLMKPDVIEKAYERVQELLADPAELTKHKKGVAQEVRDVELKAREQAVAREAFDQDFMSLAEELEAEAGRLGIAEGEDLVELKQRLVGAVRVDKRSGRIALSKQQVRQLVVDTKAEQDRRYDAIRKRLERERGKGGVDKTRRMAAEAKKPMRQAPKGVARRPVEVEKPFKPKPGEDPLRSFISRKLSGTK